MTDNNNGMYMPVAPAYGGGMGGFGGWGSDIWLILIVLFALGGFGGWGGMGGFGMGGFAADGAMLYPWMNQAEITTNGFQNQALSGQLNGIQSGVQNLSTQLCNCCSDMQMAVANGFAGVEQGANARQIANMQQAFNAQTSTLQGFNGVQGQIAQASADSRLASCQTQNIIQNEGNQTRFADANNTRDIIQSQTNGTQAILDKLCQLELDGVKAQVEAKNDRIAELQTQLNMANLAASQTAQNAFIAQGFSNEVDALYNRLNSCPVPTTPVYGRTPIFQCNGNGCGCNNF